MIIRIKRILNIKDSDTFEFRFLVIASFLSIIVGTISTVFNYLLDLGFTITLHSFYATILFIIQFIFIHKKFYYQFNKWFFFLSRFILLDMFWFENGGLSGSIIYVFLALFPIILLIWNGLQQVLILTIFIINFASLILMEYYHPELIVQYSSRELAFLDISIALVLYITGVSIIVLIAKKYYVKEYLRAQNADHMKTAFLANVSHELRTPMNSILGFSELLSPINTEDNEEFIKIINRNGNALLKLIDDIIDIAKIESNQIKLQKESVCAYQILKELKSNFDVHLSENNSSIKIDGCSKNKSTICTDQHRLKQILTNLLSNAIKFTHNGTIHVGFYNPNDSITFYVKDTGIGIAPEKLESIFDRFTKLDDPDKKNLYSGTGIGLAICKQLTNLLEGKIWVESELGKGSVFYVQLPCKINQAIPHETIFCNELKDTIC